MFFTKLLQYNFMYPIFKNHKKLIRMKIHSSEIDYFNLLRNGQYTRALLTFEKNQFIDDSTSSTLIIFIIHKPAN